MWLSCSATPSTRPAGLDTSSSRPRVSSTLKHTRYLWLHSQLPEAKQADFADLLEINLKTARAWAYKEQFVEFWAQPDAAQGMDFFSQWKRSVMRSRLTKVKAVAKTSTRHLVHLPTYFLHPITNAVSEDSTPASRPSRPMPLPALRKLPRPHPLSLRQTRPHAGHFPEAQPTRFPEEPRNGPQRRDRRFEDELHARAWLSLACSSHLLLQGHYRERAQWAVSCGMSANGLPPNSMAATAREEVARSRGRPRTGPRPVCSGSAHGSGMAATAVSGPLLAPDPGNVGSGPKRSRPVTGRPGDACHFRGNLGGPRPRAMAAADQLGEDVNGERAAARRQAVRDLVHRARIPRPDDPVPVA